MQCKISCNACASRSGIEGNGHRLPRHRRAKPHTSQDPPNANIIRLPRDGIDTCRPEHERASSARRYRSNTTRRTPPVHAHSSRTHGKRHADNLHATSATQYCHLATRRTRKRSRHSNHNQNKPCTAHPETPMQRLDLATVQKTEQSPHTTDAAKIAWMAIYRYSGTGTDPRRPLTAWLAR